MDINKFREKIMEYKPLFIPIFFLLFIILIFILSAIGELDTFVWIIVFGFVVWYLWHKFWMPVNIADIRNELRKKK